VDKKKDLKKINHIEKNFNKIYKLFLKSKYLWGGKTANGIDCSSLIQIYFLYNKIFFPRDTKDQIKFCNSKNKKKFSKGDIIFWKGHVGMCLNRSQFIHAYGPKKKVLIMPTNFTIKLINKTAKLIIRKISNIKNY
jgi:cell wall-associated NlpC family hydrolase